MLPQVTVKKKKKKVCAKKGVYMSLYFFYKKIPFPESMLFRCKVFLMNKRLLLGKKNNQLKTGTCNHRNRLKCQQS